MKRLAMLFAAVGLLVAGAAHAQIQSVTPDRLLDWKYQSIIQTVLVAGNQDSSGVPRDTRGWNWMGLMIYGQTDSTARAYLVAIEVRGHITAIADSNGTFRAEPLRPALATSNPWVPAPDTVGVFPLTAEQTKTAGMSHEILVWIPSSTGNAVLGVKGKLVRLVDRFGRDIRSPFTTIKVRAVNAYDANGAVLTGRRVVLSAHLVGGR